MRDFKLQVTVLLVASCAFVAPASAAGNLNVQVGGVTNGGPIPGQYALCVPADQGHVTRGPDKNPSISWSKGPDGTKSYVVLVSDSDSPSVRTEMNQDGKIVAADLPRLTFYHYVLVDIPPTVTQIAEGAEADGVVAHGRPATPASVGVRGVNLYTRVFATNEQMKGAYYGYDGPCPPFNDARVHHYHFAVYALDVPSLNLSGPFDGNAAISAMYGHILAAGTVTGTYTLNPALK